jgi:hypothetical protein
MAPYILQVVWRSLQDELRSATLIAWSFASLLLAKMQFAYFLGPSLVLAYLDNLAATPRVFELQHIPWTLTESTREISVAGHVPSQAHLDLLAAGIIQEPTYGTDHHCMPPPRKLTPMY